MKKKATHSSLQPRSDLENDSDANFNDLLKGFGRPGKPWVAFLGSGVSYDLMPLWMGTIEAIVDEYIFRERRHTLFNAPSFRDKLRDLGRRFPARFIETVKGKRSVGGTVTPYSWYHEMLSDVFSKRVWRHEANDPKKQMCFTPLAHALAQIPFAGYVTTNYDDGLFFALKSILPNLKQEDVLRIHDPAERNTKLPSTSPWIFHLHGHHSKAEATMVLSGDEYDMSSSDPRYHDWLARIFTDYNVVFVGYGFNDPWLDSIISKVVKPRVGPQVEAERYIFHPILPGDDTVVHESTNKVLMATFVAKSIFYDSWETGRSQHGTATFAGLIHLLNQLPSRTSPTQSSLEKMGCFVKPSAASVSASPPVIPIRSGVKKGWHEWHNFSVDIVPFRDPLNGAKHTTLTESVQLIFGNALEGRKVKVERRNSYDDVVNRIVEGKTDFAFLGPFSYIQCHKHAQPLVAQAFEFGDAYHSLLICHKDYARDFGEGRPPPISKIVQLNAKLLLGDQVSTSGFVVPMLGLAERGYEVKALESLAKIGKKSFVGVKGHSAVLDLVLKNKHGPIVAAVDGGHFLMKWKRKERLYNNIHIIHRFHRPIPPYLWVASSERVKRADLIGDVKRALSSCRERKVLDYFDVNSFRPAMSSSYEPVKRWAELVEDFGISLA